MASDRIFVVPKEGLRVRDVDGSVIPADGKSVRKCTYWNRRIRDGEVIEFDEENDEAVEG